MSHKKVGLTLGKFAPLHRGHQLVIETALREMDEVYVVIYDCPETTKIPLSVRANWLRTLYPTLHVLEAWDGPTETGDTPEIKQKQEQYILNLLHGKTITHFFSSEFYGEHMSTALHAINRLVDCRRETVPISGTAIRKEPFLNKHFLHPVVYKDLITTVVFLGAPSTGKTTIASKLAEAYQTVWVPEYGREYWEKHNVNRRLSPEQLLEIAQGHLESEDRMILQARDYVFIDTNPITTYMFALYYHGFALPELKKLADASISRYDLVFLCDDDIPYDNTPDRSGETQRATFQKQIVADLVCRKIPFITLRGDIEQRMREVESVLKRYTKFSSLGDFIACFDA